MINLTIDKLKSKKEYPSENIDPDGYYSIRDIVEKDLMCWLVTKTNCSANLKFIRDNFKGKGKKGRWNAWKIKGEIILKEMQRKFDYNIIAKLKERNRTKDLLRLSTGNTNF